MVQQVSLFSLFGGIRPMARAIGEPSSNVGAWKREGRIPAAKQPHVLEVGQSIGLPITAEHVVFPLGRRDAARSSGVARPASPVVCDRQVGMQR